MIGSKTVAVVDYGMGNLWSVSQAVRHVAQGGGYEVLVTSNPQDVMAAERVILPGQGAMADCMHELTRSGMRQAVLHAAANKPLFGVCVGMQMLLGHSAEGAPGDGGAGTPGLGLIPGNVLRFELSGRLQPDGSRYKVPQMGWNQVYQGGDERAALVAAPLAISGSADAALAKARWPVHALWQGVPDGSHFYFVHSYYACPSDARHTVGQADYGGRFAAVIARDNIFATQFHPEKSAAQGLALYRNFLHWAP